LNCARTFEMTAMPWCGSTRCVQACETTAIESSNAYSRLVLRRSLLLALAVSLDLDGLEQQGAGDVTLQAETVRRSHRLKSSRPHAAP
jgi:hypothetical protein